MSAESNPDKMGAFDVKKDEKGNVYFEMEDPSAAARRRLHPDTGTEADEQWPVPNTDPDDSDAPPPIDLELAWCEIIAGTPITVAVDETVPDGATVEARNAALIVRELRYHILASTAGVPRKNAQAELEQADAAARQSRGEASERAEEQQVKLGDKEADEKEGNGEEGEDDDQLKSVYGASILLKLQWEDRSKQKSVPPRTYTELALFISDITMNLETVLEKNPAAGKEVVDTLAFELTQLLLTRYIEGMETCTKVLEDCSFTLLTFCAEHASPKEMHMAIKAFTSRIDSVYFEATSYLIAQPLLILWGKVIARMPRKRQMFLRDYTKVLDRMQPSAESYQTTFVPESGGVGVERCGRVSRIPEAYLDFLESLLKTQVMQRETDSTISLEVDMLGREKMSTALKAITELQAGDKRSSNENQTGAKEKKGCNGEGSSGEQNICEHKSSEVTTDWVNERAMTLAKLLQVQNMLWNRLAPPPGEDRNVPKRMAKTIKRERMGKKGKPSAEAREKSLARCVGLFRDLGWTNPVVVCQLAANGLNLSPASRSGELMKIHIGEDIRSRKERKNTLYSVASVGQYLCGVLRRGTRRYLSKTNVDSDGDDYDVDLSGSAFDLLDPRYALDLVMPYLMQLIPQSGAAVSMSGILTIRPFLDRIPDNEYKVFDNVLRLGSGTGCMGREVCLYGLAQHLGKAVSGLDDPKHRRIAYETLQVVLRKCASAHVKYVIAESMFYETPRVVVAGQLMTMMKDAVQCSDIVSWSGENANGDLRQASQLRSRFAEDCLPRYFTPRKELLVSMNPIATAASMLVFLAVGDRRFLNRVGETDEKVKKEIEKRMRFSKEYGRLGKECIRALASVAEHDRKSVPTSALAKTSAADAVALYAASGRTLNQCVGALSYVDLAMESL